MDSDTTTASALGLVRHILSALCGALVLYGVINPDQSATLLNDGMQAAGAILGIGAVIWSIKNKQDHTKALAIASAAGIVDGAKATAQMQAKGPPGPLGPKVGAIIFALVFAGLSLQACSTVTGSADTAATTPRQTLGKIEASYTAAVQTANDSIANHIITGHTIAQVASYDKYAAAALDNADAAVALAEKTPTPQNQVQAQQALEIAQQAVAGILATIQQQQGH